MCSTKGVIRHQHDDIIDLRVGYDRFDKGVDRSMRISGRAIFPPASSAMKTVSSCSSLGISLRATGARWTRSALAKASI